MLLARSLSLSLNNEKKRKKNRVPKREADRSIVPMCNTNTHLDIQSPPCARLSQMPPYTSVHTPNRKKPVHACWTLVYSTKIRIRIPPIDGVDEEEEEEEEEEVVVMMDDLRGGVLFGWQQSTSH